MGQEIQFRTNRKKAIEALVFLAGNQPRIDVFHICKVIYFADREHLRKFGRPVLGDNYFAMDDGPVPSFILDVTKRSSFLSSEWKNYAGKRLVVDDKDGYVRLIARTQFDDSLFSRTDIECLRESLGKYGEMPFLELWQLVHKEQAWKENYKGSGTSTKIPYEDLIPSGMKNREKAIEQLREVATVTEI